MQDGLFTSFFVTKGLNKADADHLSAEIQNTHPWLDFKDELSELLAAELFDSDFDLTWQKIASQTELVDWYNKEVRRLQKMDQSTCTSDDAYTDLCRVVSCFGKEDAFGEGDFWVVSDSFSELSPSIIAYQLVFPLDKLQMALHAWKGRHPTIKSVSIIDEDGTLKLRV
jgi:hypothetical protein